MACFDRRTLCCVIGLCAAAAPAKPVKPKDPLEPARAALRTLQFNKAIELLGAAGNGGNADAQYLLGLMYLNGVGVVSDPAHARALLQSAAEHGQARGGLCARRANSRTHRTRRPIRRNDGWSVRRSLATCAPPRRCGRAGRCSIASFWAPPIRRC